MGTSNLLRKVAARMINKLTTVQTSFKKSLLINFKGQTFFFETKSDISRKWLFPRYAKGNPHEPVLCEFLSETLPEDAVFFDVGANIGFFSIFAGVIRSKINVHAFELDSDLIKTVRENTILNDISHKVEVNLCAISNNDAEMLYFSPRQAENVSTNMISKEKSDQYLGYSIPSVTLDRYSNDKNLNSIDVIKMDIEGAEIYAIDGMVDILEKFSPVVIMEIHPKQIKEFGLSEKHIFNIMRQQGYKAYTLPNHKNFSGDSKFKLQAFESDVIQKTTMFIFDSRPN